MSQSSTLEKLEGLKRRIDISVPAEEVNAVYQKKVQKISKTAKIDGFRPGKVPLALIEKRYGNGLLIEVAQELIESSLTKAIQEMDIHIAGRPSVSPKEIKHGQPFDFKVEFEVYPEINLVDMSSISLTRQELVVQESDIDNMLKTLQKQRADWQEVNREAVNGDQLDIDFTGFLAGEPFDNGSSQHFKLELGAKQMIPGFEEQLMGVKVSDERDIECTFPENYPNEQLAGKKATFKIKVNKVCEPSLPELNDEFAKSIGISTGITGLRQEVEKNMRNQVGQLLKDKLKAEVMDKLLELNHVTVPTALVESEIVHLKKMMQQELSKQNKKVTEVDLPDSHFQEQATRRVTLGLLLGEIIKAHHIKVDGKKVRERIEQIASVYNEPEQVVNWYYHNKQMLNEIESVVIEDQVIEKILDNCQMTHKTVSYEEAVHPHDKEDAQVENDPT